MIVDKLYVTLTDAPAPKREMNTVYRRDAVRLIVSHTTTVNVQRKQN